VTEPFDWAQVTHAAQNWMESSPDQAPKYLLLPMNTSDEIMDLAAEIYGIDARRVVVEVPRFGDEIPVPPAKSIIHGKLFDPQPQREFSIVSLQERAKAGTLTTADIQRMSMEEYASVRHLLLRKVDEAVKGKSFGEITKDWH